MGLFKLLATRLSVLRTTPRSGKGCCTPQSGKGCCGSRLEPIDGTMKHGTSPNK